MTEGVESGGYAPAIVYLRVRLTEFALCLGYCASGACFRPR
jgi:hypothetical protein